VRESIAKAAEILRGCGDIVAFTGAGISAESGIPTYRGEKGSWSKYDPAKYASVEYFFRNPAYYWSFFRDERYPVIQKARPNHGHKALARMEETGRLRCVITQNIDGLQQLAGSKNVVELHGNTRSIGCLDCDLTHAMDEVYAQLKYRDVPQCTHCGGQLKTRVVLFGEGLPQQALAESFDQASHCDAMLCVGSTLVVYPAAGIPQIAADKGAKIIIVNKGPTPLDDRAHVVIDGPAGEVLPEILEVDSP